MNLPYILFGGHKNIPDKYWARAVTANGVKEFKNQESRAMAIAAAIGTLPINTPIYDISQCVHCLKDNYDEFMVGPTVWVRAGLHSLAGRLHFKCLEERIGRPLTLIDFTAANCNIGIKFGYEMASRPAFHQAATESIAAIYHEGKKALLYEEPEDSGYHLPGQHGVKGN